jgi:predicted RNase H-like HicB family nuclease
MRISEYTAVIEYDAEAQRYVGHVPALRGAHTEADTLEQLRAGLEDVVRLVLDAMEEQGNPAGADTVVGLEKVAVRR